MPAPHAKQSLSGRPAATLRLPSVLVACGLVLAAAGLEQGAALAAPPDEAVLTLPEAIRQVAEAMAPDAENGYVYFVGPADRRSVLDGYQAHMLALRLRQAGVRAETFPAGVPRERTGFPSTLSPRLQGELRDTGGDRFVTAASTIEDGQSHLDVGAYDIVSGRLRRTVSVPVRLPDDLSGLAARQPARLARADRQWLEFFDALFADAPGPAETEESAVPVAEAEFFFANGLWAEAGMRLASIFAGRPSDGLARAVMARQLAGQETEATALVGSALRQYPDSGPVWVLKAWLSLRQGHPDDATMYLAEGRLWGMAREGLYRYARGLVAVEQRDDDVARAELEAAADSLPHAHFAQLQLARFYSSRAELDRAVGAYTRATQADGADEDTWGELAVALEAGGHVVEALEALRRGFDINSGNLGVTRHFAALLRRQGHHEEAVDVLRRAARANPRSPSLIAAYGDAAFDLWKLDEAAGAFAEAAAVGEESGYAMVRLATVHRLRREYGEAKQILSDLLAARPDRDSARIEMARLLAEIEHVDEALSVLQPMTALPDREVDARVALAEICLEADRVPESVASAQIAAAARQDAATYAVLARAFLAAGETAKAENAAAFAVQKDPMSPDAHVAVGAAALARGAVAAASESARRALELHPYHVPALELAGNVRLAEGNFQKCAECWQRALNLDPWCARLHRKLSDLLGPKLGDWRGTERHLARYVELEKLRAEAGL